MVGLGVEVSWLDQMKDAAQDVAIDMLLSNSVAVVQQQITALNSTLIRIDGQLQNNTVWLR